MSILNLASDGLPNVLVVLYDALARSTRPVARDDLLEMVAPKGVAHEEGKQARQTLVRWIELGLFALGSDGVELVERPQQRLDNDAELVAHVRRAARARVLHPDNNMDLWATESARAADFTRSIAWTLAQDVYRPLYSNLETLERSQMADGTAPLMQNNTRRTGLKVWGQFLGFLRPVLKSEIEVDPTVAIRDVLPLLLQPGQNLPVANVIDDLAMTLPILDGGVWRREVQAHMRPDALPPMAEGQLSPSLSRALLNLMRNEEIFLENRADTRSGVVLTGQAGVRTDLRFTWIRRAEARSSAA
jgi:hypothetical protein